MTDTEIFLFIKRTDARGNTTEFKYDSSGLLTEKTAADGSAYYTYDAAGNLLSAENSAGTITKQYNSLGQRISLTTATGKAFTYEYNLNGNYDKNDIS